MSISRPSQSTFRAARGLAIFLSIGGIAWTVFFLWQGYATGENPGILLGILIVALWLLRAFNIGSRRVWVVFWGISACWHLLYAFGGIGLALLGGRVLGLSAWALVLLPLGWVIIAFAGSIAGLVSELERFPNVHRRF